MRVADFEGRRCEEVIGSIGNMPVKCLSEAVVRVQHARRSEGPYDMCAAHGDHNIRNRGAYALEVHPALESFKDRWSVVVPHSLGGLWCRACLTHTMIDQGVKKPLHQSDCPMKDEPWP